MRPGIQLNTGRRVPPSFEPAWWSGVTQLGNKEHAERQQREGGQSGHEHKFRSL